MAGAKETGLKWTIMFDTIAKQPVAHVNMTITAGFLWWFNLPIFPAGFLCLQQIRTLPNHAMPQSTAVFCTLVQTL